MNCIKDVYDKLNTLEREQLVEALADIAKRLSFDEHGTFNPEESVAANSGADFIESVGFTFELLGINI